jgi:hypothetical protein
MKAVKCRHCGQSLAETQNPQISSRSWDDPIATIIIAIILLILYLTNPSEKEFKDAITQRIDESGIVDKSNPFQQLMVGIASYAINAITTRSNYYIFSIFEIDSSLLKMIDNDTPKLKFIGIAGHIIPLFNANSDLSDSSSPIEGSDGVAKSEPSTTQEYDSTNENYEGPEMKPFVQNCRGKLVKDDEYGLSLENYPSNNLWDTWCDAGIDDLSDKVLKVCSINNKCEIRGQVMGHGVFHWHQINQVSKIEAIEEGSKKDASINTDDSLLAEKNVHLVKSFYMALSDGNGELANSFLVPEKRNVGNFKTENIRSFYSQMKQKLEINSITPIDKSTVKVNFNYTVNKNQCNGLSTVKLRKTDSNTIYIEKISSNC